MKSSLSEIDSDSRIRHLMKIVVAVVVVVVVSWKLTSLGVVVMISFFSFFDILLCSSTLTQIVHTQSLARVLLVQEVVVLVVVVERKN